MQPLAYRPLPSLSSVIISHSKRKNAEIFVTYSDVPGKEEALNEVFNHWYHFPAIWAAWSYFFWISFGMAPSADTVTYLPSIIKETSA